MGCLRCSKYIRCRIQLPLNNHRSCMYTARLKNLRTLRSERYIDTRHLIRTFAIYSLLLLHTLSWGRHIYRLHITASLTRALVRARTKVPPASPTTRSPIELNLHLFGPPACTQGLAHLTNIDSRCFGPLSMLRREDLLPASSLIAILTTISLLISLSSLRYAKDCKLCWTEKEELCGAACSS